MSHDIKSSFQESIFILTTEFYLKKNQYLVELIFFLQFSICNSSREVVISSGTFPLLFIFLRLKKRLIENMMTRVYRELKDSNIRDLNTQLTNEVCYFVIFFFLNKKMKCLKEILLYKKKYFTSKKNIKFQ